MRIHSPAFENGGSIPPEYTKDGSNTPPPLIISGVPSRARSLVLVMDDPDAPKETFVHWVAYNIEPGINAFSDWSRVDMDIGINDFGKLGYDGPAPLKGRHRYYIKIYALDEKLDLEKPPAKDDVMEAIDGHILSSSGTMCTY